MNARTYTSLIAAAAGLAIAATACSGSVPNRAGGSIVNTKVTVLTLASTSGAGAPPQVTDWINQVHALSDGSIRIDVTDAWRYGQTHYEANTVQDVKQGKVDMAWVGARIMDRVGDTSFQALLAPMLVDSYDLEERVFHAGIPAQMLTGVAAAGVVGVAALPGPMRKVLGIAKPFLTPADFAGTRIADQDSALAQLALRTLGATPVPVPGGVTLHGVDGYEQQLESIAGNNYDTIAKYTTANLNLWPRPPLIIMGTAAWAKLTDTQRDILRKAAATVLPRAFVDTHREDQQSLPQLCKNGMRFPTASRRQLTQMRTALQPVYASLHHNASTSKWLDQIQSIKQQLDAAPETVSCTGIGRNSQPASPIDGTYWRRGGLADVRAACHGLPSGAGSSPAHNTLEVVFDHGDVTQYEQDATGPKYIGWRGTYQVYRDSLELVEGGKAPPMTLTWSLNGSTLKLSNLRNGYNCTDTATWAHSWTKRK